MGGDDQAEVVDLGAARAYSSGKLPQNCGVQARCMAPFVVADGVIETLRKNRPGYHAGRGRGLDCTGTGSGAS